MRNVTVAINVNAIAPHIYPVRIIFPRRTDIRNSTVSTNETTIVGNNGAGAKGDAGEQIMMITGCIVIASSKMA